MIDLIPQGTTVMVGGCAHDVETAGVVTPDSATFDVFEGTNDTPLLAGQTLTERSGFTGVLRGTFVASSGNGFDVGTQYQAVLTATVSGIVGRKLYEFRVIPTEVSAGVPEVNVKSITAGVIAAASFAANALDAVWSTATRILTAATNLSIPTATENADALLKRDMSAVSGESSRSPLNAFRFLRNKWTIAGGTLTVKKEDDTTSAWSGSVATTAGDPVSSIDPS